VERFRAWLEAFARALEEGDPAAAASLFAVGSTYRSGPFAPVLRGRRAIQAHLEALIGGRPGMVIRARALGMGVTYGLAHWVAAWPADGSRQRDAQAAGDARTSDEPLLGTDAPSGAERISDGILLVAFDPVGRCTSLREWSVQGAGEGVAAGISVGGPEP
jgi:hypothetical protein